MTRSIFDPSGDTERSGSTFTPPEAQQDSHLPKADAEADSDTIDEEVDGKVEFDSEGEETATEEEPK